MKKINKQKIKLRKKVLLFIGPGMAIVITAIVAPVVTMSNQNKALIKNNNNLNQQNQNIKEKLDNLKENQEKMYSNNNQFLGVFTNTTQKIKFLSANTLISSEQFKNETRITYIDIPGIVSIGYASFKNNIALKEVYLNNVIKIENFVFQGDTALKKYTCLK